MATKAGFVGTVLLVLVASCASAGAGSADGQPVLHRVNIIDGADDRDSLLTLGPVLGLSSGEMARIRKVSGYVGCRSPSIALGSGALFLTNRQILTAAHIFLEPSGRKRSRCIFKNQDADHPVMIELMPNPGSAKFGAEPPKPGSNDDYAIVHLAEPVPDAMPFPVADAVPVENGDALIVVTAHPAGMAKEVDIAVPVVQGCKVRRAPKSAKMMSFYRSECDATGASSGGMNLARINGRLVYRGVTISAGPWESAKLAGAPYDEAKGSATTALGTDAAVLKAGEALSAGE
jgi:hypothetical protein